jgi:excisionase family DNA binding protein
MTVSQRPFLSIRELSLMLGLNYRTVSQMVTRGEIPHIRVGRTIRVHRDVVRVFEERAQHEVARYLAAKLGPGGKKFAKDCYGRRAARPGEDPLDLATEALDRIRQARETLQSDTEE